MAPIPTGYGRAPILYGRVPILYGQAPILYGRGHFISHVDLPEDKQSEPKPRVLFISTAAEPLSMGFLRQALFFA
jgi:hypothetical protein